MPLWHEGGQERCVPNLERRTTVEASRIRSFSVLGTRIRKGKPPRSHNDTKDRPPSIYEPVLLVVLTASPWPCGFVPHPKGLQGPPDRRRGPLRWESEESRKPVGGRVQSGRPTSHGPRGFKRPECFEWKASCVLAGRPPLRRSDWTPEDCARFVAHRDVKFLAGLARNKAALRAARRLHLFDRPRTHAPLKS